VIEYQKSFLKVRRAMSKKSTRKSSGIKSQKPIEQYEHKDKQRLNNPPVGLVDAHTDNGGAKKKQYAYDPHLDPQLQWAARCRCCISIRRTGSSTAVIFSRL